MAEDSKDKEQNQYLTATEYLSCRDGYDKAEIEVSGRYDQWILTLSGGALAISITFIEKIAPAPAAHTLCWLKCSWLLFVVSLLGSLVSLLTSQSAIREQRRELDKAYQERTPPVHKSRKCFTYLTNLLNWGSALIFVAGVSCLCMFAIINAPKQKEEQANAKRQETQPTTVDGKLHSAATDQENRTGLRPAATTAEAAETADQEQESVREEEQVTGEPTPARYRRYRTET